MGEKRFIFYEYDDGTETIEDTEENEYYHFSNELVGLLNEQQATTTKLKELNDDKGKKIISLIRTNKTLKEENEQLKQELAELLAVHTKIVETLDSEFVSKALEDGD